MLVMPSVVMLNVIMPSLAAPHLPLKEISFFSPIHLVSKKGEKVPWLTFSGTQFVKIV